MLSMGFLKDYLNQFKICFNNLWTSQNFLYRFGFLIQTWSSSIPNIIGVIYATRTMGAVRILKYLEEKLFLGSNWLLFFIKLIQIEKFNLCDFIIQREYFLMKSIIGSGGPHGESSFWKRFCSYRGCFITFATLSTQVEQSAISNGNYKAGKVLPPPRNVVEGYNCQPLHFLMLVIFLSWSNRDDFFISFDTTTQTGHMYATVVDTT